MDIGRTTTALVVIDPQTDVLGEDGRAWDLVKDSVIANDTVENIASLFEVSLELGYTVLVSPHYLFESDQDWAFAGAAEQSMLDRREFYRPEPLDVAGLRGSGADWVDRLRPYVEDEATVVISPHKVWGPQSNDLVLQLRKRSVSNVILAGMMANLCVESHLRELLEQGSRSLWSATPPQGLVILSWVMGMRRRSRTSASSPMTSSPRRTPWPR